VLALAGATCGPPPNWKCTDNAGFNCTCRNPPGASDTGASCGSYPCCIHYEDASGQACTCKNVSANTCATTEIDARTATGATNVKLVSACPQ
jgi:hypothetical protein